VGTADCGSDGTFSFVVNSGNAQGNCLKPGFRRWSVGMATVPAACSALADEAAALEAEERSLRAALANLSGFAAWATLVRPSRVQDDLDKFRLPLRGCIDISRKRITCCRVSCWSWM
jgi:hypothetical protein